jgi:pimeloyl-ACP methyl ester carboxylesterase
MKPIAFLLLPLLAQAADYPQWRGPQRDGYSPETGLMKQWPQGGPKMAWRAAGLGSGYGAPAVAGSRLFLIANEGNEHEYLRALSAADGKLLWSVRLGRVGNPDQQPSYPGARSTPSVDGDLVYAMSSDGELVCVEAASGKERWRKSARNDFGGRPHKWAYAESPLIDGGKIIMTPGGADATMVALDKKTGAVVWKSAVPGGPAPGYASAIVVNAAGRRQYVQFLENGVIGVDADSGKFLWLYKETSKGPANIPTPVGHGDYVYSTARSMSAGGLVQLKPVAGGVEANQVYFERGLPSAIGGSVVVNGVNYGASGSDLVASDLVTGKVLWTNPSVGAASVVYADGHLYVYGEDGDVALVEATPEAYREKGRFTPPGHPEHPRGAREKSWAYPVVANGRLYLRDLDVLWAYDIKTGAAAANPAAGAASVPPAPPAHWTDGYVMANGIRLHYWRTGGNKPPMVMAHGSSDDGLCWTNFAKEFEDRYDIILFDARGHGLSDPPSPGDPPYAQAEDLAALIRELKLDKPIVIGHSMGSSSAAWFAARHPDVARAIVLEDPGLLPRPAMAAPATQADRDKRVAEVIARNNTPFQDLVDRCMKNSPLWGLSECQFWAPSKRRHHPVTALTGFGGRPPMAEIFSQVTVPVLIIKAGAPPDVRKQNEEVAAKLAKGKIVHIDGAGHNVRRERKQQTVDALNAFLKGL